MSAAKRTAVRQINVERIALACGCVNRMDGQIDFCKLHAAASQVTRRLRAVSEMYHEQSAHDDEREAAIGFSTCPDPTCKETRSVLKKADWQ
jgi:hypothetical protein